MENKIKVLHYYTYPENSGGPLTYIQNIMNSKYFDKYTFGVCFQLKPLSKLRLNDFKRILKEIKAFQPDILHVHGLQSEGFLGLLLGRRAKVKKILMTVHGLQIDAQNINKLKLFLFKYLIEPYTLKKSDGVYCVCKKTENRDIIKKNSKKLYPCIYNFITDDFLLNKNMDNTIYKNKDQIILSYIGRVSIDKGMKELEKCIMSDTRDNTQYWIIGDGEYKVEMEKKLKSCLENKKVIFWGFQKNIKKFLKQTDIFVFLSHHENLSIALLEAASQNCCCIVTNVGGNSEVVFNEVDGILITPFDSQEAKRGIQSLLEDTKKMKEYGNMIGYKVRKQFSEKKFYLDLDQIYKSLIEGAMNESH